MPANRNGQVRFDGITAEGPQSIEIIHRDGDLVLLINGHQPGYAITSVAEAGEITSEIEAWRRHQRNRETAELLRDSKGVA